MSSKNSKKTYRDILNSSQKPKPTTISFKESVSVIDKQSNILPMSLEFELKFFIISLSTLLSTSIYVNKSYLNNYNFKLIFLIALYFLRRLLFQIYYHFYIKQNLIFIMNYVIIILFIGQVVVNVLYIFYDLIVDYSIYSLLPLFYFTLFQIPIFFFDKEKRYEHPSKELIHMIKKILYLSLEVCYYAIFMPVFFAMKNNHFFNAFALYVYTFFAWINAFMFLFSFNYFKKSAEFHFYSTSAGNWKKITKKEMTTEQFSKIKVWDSLQNYEKNSIVEYKGKYYIGLEDKNYVEPNNLYMGILYKLFIDPKNMFSKLVLLQDGVTITQCVFYIVTQFNIFSLTQLISSWYVFYEIYKMNLKLREIFNRKKFNI